MQPKHDPRSQSPKQRELQQNQNSQIKNNDYQLDKNHPHYINNSPYTNNINNNTNNIKINNNININNNFFSNFGQNNNIQTNFYTTNNNNQYNHPHIPQVIQRNNVLNSNNIQQPNKNIIPVNNNKILQMNQHMIRNTNTNISNNKQLGNYQNNIDPLQDINNNSNIFNYSNFMRGPNNQEISKQQERNHSPNFKQLNVYQTSQFIPTTTYQRQFSPQTTKQNQQNYLQPKLLFTPNQNGIQDQNQQSVEQQQGANKQQNNSPSRQQILSNQQQIQQNFQQNYYQQSDNKIIQQLKYDQNLDDFRDSLSQNMDSISEFTDQGKKLVQNLYPSINTQAAKLPQAIQIKQFDPLAFQIRNQDTGEVINFYEYEKMLRMQSNFNKTNQNFQEWWNIKKKNSNNLILMTRLNQNDKVIELLDKKKDDLRPDVNFKDNDGNTPLHYTCLNGNVSLTILLLYNEANIEEVNNQQQIPFMLACQEGHEEVANIMLNAGSDINHQDIYGNTVLHYAVLRGQYKILDLLFKKPSLMQLKNKNQKTALEICPNQEIKQYFEALLQQQNHQDELKIFIHQAQDDKVNNMFKNIVIQDKKSTASTNTQSGHYKNSTSSELSSNNDIEQKKSSEKIGPDDFKIHGLIGKGSFGEVYLVEKKNAKDDQRQIYAMKALQKNKISKNNLIRYAVTERNVLSLTNHPFIVKLCYAFQTKDKLFLILEYCPGGDLGELLQKEKKLQEDQVRIYLAEILVALEYLHQKDIIFRDLKPDNIVLDAEGHALLTDFGLSKEGVLDYDSGARSFCGSVAYLAPEMLKRQGHGKAVDWYLLGVVMYELLVGIPPYYTNNRDQLFQNIEQAPLKLPQSLSEDAKSLLKELLQRNPQKRLGSGKGDAEEIKQHPFFASLNWSDVEKRKLKPPKIQRKLRICTKYDPYIFDNSSFSGSMVDPDMKYVPGWSFVNQNLL